MSRVLRVVSLALAVFLVGCAAQLVAPRRSDTITPSARPLATNAASDVLLVRGSFPSELVQILAIDARTGARLQTLPDGSLSFDGKVLYVTDQAAGGTQTVVRALEVASKRELRSFTLSGAYRTIWSDGGESAVSRDGRHLVLSTSPYKLDGDWVTGFKVLDTASGLSEASLDLKGQSIFRFQALSVDGRSLYLSEFGSGTSTIRVFDIPSATLLPAAAIAGSGTGQDGYRTLGARSADGRRMYFVDAGTTSTNCTSTDGPACVPNATPPALVALDLASRRAQRVQLPKEQVSSDFEKYLLWSVAIPPSGATVYAVNPALGVIDEIDADTLVLRRTAPITVSRADDGVLAALGQFLLPVAEAKRYTTGVALTSPDGSRIYAVAGKGIAVVDARDLSSIATWERAGEFDALLLTPDGGRLYAVSNGNNTVVIVSIRDGTRLGELNALAPGFVSILRLEP